MDYWPEGLCRLRIQLRCVCHSISAADKGRHGLFSFINLAHLSKALQWIQMNVIACSQTTWGGSQNPCLIVNSFHELTSNARWQVEPWSSSRCNVPPISWSAQDSWSGKCSSTAWSGKENEFCFYSFNLSLTYQLCQIPSISVTEISQNPKKRIGHTSGRHMI